MGEPTKRKREVTTVQIDSDGDDDIEIMEYYESDNEEDDIKTVDSDKSDNDDIEIDIGVGLDISRSSSVKNLKNTPQPKTLNIKIQTTPLISKQFGNPDPEIYPDDNTDKGRKQRVLATVRWNSDPVKTRSRKTNYKEVTLKLGPCEKKVVPGTNLLITPDEEEHQSVAHYPCRVLSLFTMKWEGKQRNMAHVQWFTRGENTILGRTSDPREWFLLEECEDVFLESVSRILDIEYLPVEDFAKWRKQGGTRAAITKEGAGGKDGWWRLLYQPEFGRFPFPDKDAIEIKGPGECYLCDKEDRDEIVGEDGKSVRIQGSWYFVGQLLMITDSTIPFKILAKVPKSYPKAEVDSKMYPEHWRKPAEYKGDHVDTWQPFQIVRLEQVVKTRKEFFIRVRKLYRPHDTHLSHEEARTKPYSLLYWSEEIVRMYPRKEVTRNNNNKISMDDIVGNCYVLTLENIRQENDLITWTDEGEDRFFVDKMYNADRKTFEPLQNHVIKELNQAHRLWPSPILEEVTALNTMDIFSGCGGLSAGLSQAGVANPKWAVDYWDPAADAYRKNNPGAEVYNQECNDFLQKVMEDSDQSTLPKKGDVDLLVGGPPCQGFSILNRFKNRENSVTRNSLITTYLSCCDFYRPLYVVLENVQNIIQYENSMVLKLIMASLVKMGYSVGKFK